MNSICLIDLDDTLVDLKEPLMEALNKNTKKDIHWSKWYTFDVPKLYDITHDEFIKICITENVIEKAVIHNKSYEFLDKLNKLGLYTVLITARGWHPDAINLTEHWVSEHNLNIDELIIVGVNESKIHSIKKFNNIIFSVDDRIKHCREYTQSGKINNVIVYDAPWNTHMTRWNKYWKGYDYNIRIKDLNEIIPHVESHELDRRILNVC
jgi:hypothetical protein